MNPTSLLTGSHLRTYNTIFQHPISHNLKWQDVHALFRELGQIEEEPNGNMKVTRNGQTLVLHPPRTKDVSEMDEIISLRHFIERSEAEPAEVNKMETHCLLVIDHHEARIFHSEMNDSILQLILPHKPEDYFRHGQDSKEVSRGQEKPDPNSFFEPVAKALAGRSHILIFGTGTGMSSEMDQFVAWLKTHHPELAKRVIGSQVVDEHHLTEGQLLAKAREFYANAAKLF
jgi:hypothetical protein